VAAHSTPCSGSFRARHPLNLPPCLRGGWRVRYFQVWRGLRGISLTALKLPLSQRAGPSSDEHLSIVQLSKGRRAAVPGSRHKTRVQTEMQSGSRRETCLYACSSLPFICKR
jgi:hypothetical protein